MYNTQDNDLRDCLINRPKRTYPVPSTTTQELASELLSMVNEDSSKAMAIIRKIMFYSPNKSINWYYEQAIFQLNQNLYSSVG